MLHYIKGGCNGIGAWIFNSVLNGAILLLFLNFYVKMHLRKRKRMNKVGGNGNGKAIEEEELDSVKDKTI